MQTKYSRALILVLIGMAVVALTLQILSSLWVHQTNISQNRQETNCSLIGCSLLNSLTIDSRNYSQYILTFVMQQANTTFASAETIIVPMETVPCQSQQIKCYYQAEAIARSLTLLPANLALIRSSIFNFIVIALLTGHFLLLIVLFIKLPSDLGYVQLED